MNTAAKPSYTLLAPRSFNNLNYSASCEANLDLTQAQWPYFTHMSQSDPHMAYFLLVPSKLLLLTRLPEDQD